MKRLYIVDDDPAVARTVARSASSIGFETRIFDSASALLASLDELDHGCVVLDVRMPGMGGLDLLDILKSKCPGWPVVMLTAYAELGSAVRSFRAGAVHFLAKPFKRVELLAALDEAAALAERRARLTLDPGQVAAIGRLTPREKQILAAIAEGLQSKAIAWKLGISVRTVDLHRSNILAKLSVRNTSQAVAIAKACDFAQDGG